MRRSQVQRVRVVPVLFGHVRQHGRFVSQLRKLRSPAQNVIQVSHHDPLHVLQLVGNQVQVPLGPAVHVGLAGALDVSFELDEAVRSGLTGDSRSVLHKKLRLDFVEVGESELLAEGLFAEHEVADGLADYVVEHQLVAGLDGEAVGRLLVQFPEYLLGLPPVLIERPLFFFMHGCTQSQAVADSCYHCHQHHGYFYFICCKTEKWVISIISFQMLGI